MGVYIPDITVEMLKKVPLEAVEALLAEGEMYDAELPQWIPCSKRLPSDDEDDEDNVDVLAWVESEYDARIACCNYGKGVWFDAIMDVKVSPVAWMPLPAPYKKGADDD